MNLKPIRQEFNQLTAKYHPPCPQCRALAALSDDELRELDEYTSGKIPALSPALAAKEWPESSPWCKCCGMG